MLEARVKSQQIVFAARFPEEQYCASGRNLKACLTGDLLLVSRMLNFHSKKSIAIYRKFVAALRDTRFDDASVRIEMTQLDWFPLTLNPYPFAPGADRDHVLRLELAARSE